MFDREVAKKSIDITPVLEISRTDMITTILTQSDMISFLPDFATKRLVDKGVLCYLDICDVDVEIWKQLIYHKDKWLSKSMKAFIDYIKEKEFSHEYTKNALRFKRYGGVLFWSKEWPSNFSMVTIKTNNAVNDNLQLTLTTKSVKFLSRKNSRAKSVEERSLS